MQDPGDGKLEVVTFRNLPTVILDPLLQKTSLFGPRRIFSGAPLYLQFVPAEEDDVISYCQVDGEFFKLVNPSDVVVSQIMRLRVLHNEEADAMSSSESSSEEEDEKLGCCWWSLFSRRGPREPRYRYAQAPSEPWSFD